VDDGVGLLGGQTALEQVGHLAEQRGLPGALFELVHPIGEVPVGLLQSLLDLLAPGDVVDEGHDPDPFIVSV